MSLVVLLGGARAGKSAVAERMALAHEGTVIVAVAGSEHDDEMRRRIQKHRDERPATFGTLEIADAENWLSGVPADALLVVDCLTTLVGRILGRVWMESGGDEAEATGVIGEELELESTLRVESLTLALAQRRARTIVVTNEVGEGVVPATPMGRLFRDLLGAANRRLVGEADGAWLIVAGRCVDLAHLPKTPKWPNTNKRRNV